MLGRHILKTWVSMDEILLLHLKLMGLIGKSMLKYKLNRSSTNSSARFRLKMLIVIYDTHNTEGLITRMINMDFSRVSADGNIYS